MASRERGEKKCHAITTPSQFRFVQEDFYFRSRYQSYPNHFFLSSFFFFFLDSRICNSVPSCNFLDPKKRKKKKSGKFTSFNPQWINTSIQPLSYPMNIYERHAKFDEIYLTFYKRFPLTMTMIKGWPISTFDGARVNGMIACIGGNCVQLAGS